MLDPFQSCRKLGLVKLNSRVSRLEPLSARNLSTDKSTSGPTASFLMH